MLEILPVLLDSECFELVYSYIRVALHQNYFPEPFEDCDCDTFNEYFSSRFRVLRAFTLVSHLLDVVLYKLVEYNQTHHYLEK